MSGEATAACRTGQHSACIGQPCACSCHPGVVKAVCAALVTVANDFGEGDQIAGDVTKLARCALETVREHLVRVVIANANAGNDILLGALLDAVRELETKP